MAKSLKKRGGFAGLNFIVTLLITIAYAWLAFKNEEYQDPKGYKCCARDDPNFLVPLACPEGKELPTFTSTSGWTDFFKGSLDQTKATVTSAAATGTAEAAKKLEEVTDVGTEEAAKVVENVEKLKKMAEQQGAPLIEVSSNWMMFVRGYFILNCVNLLIGICMCCAMKNDCCGSIANCLNCLTGIAMLVLLIMGFASRFSKTGQICAGDVSDEEPGFGGAYYKNTGKFLKWILIIQICLIFVCCFCVCCCFKRKDMKSAKWGNDSE